MNEIPDGAVIYFQPALGKIGNQPAQGELSFLDPLQEPEPVLAGNQLWPVSTHPSGRNAAGFAQAPHPVNGGADAYPKLFCLTT